jgi:hypothetical protein
VTQTVVVHLTCDVSTKHTHTHTHTHTHEAQRSTCTDITTPPFPLPVFRAVDKAQIEAEAEVAAEATVRARRIEEEHIQRLKEDLEARRKAREAAELVYSSDLATTLRRLRELELGLDGSRAAVSSAYERRRLHDALRRIRTSRLSLGEQALDNDYRSRRLGSLLDSPALYVMPTTFVCAAEHLLVDERSCWPMPKLCGATRCQHPPIPHLHYVFTFVLYFADTRLRSIWPRALNVNRYTGLASRAYDFYPYSRYSRSYYPYSTAYDYGYYGYPYASVYSSYYRTYPYLY